MPVRLSFASVREFIAARFLLRDDALWRVMGLLRPYRGRVALANLLIGLSNALMAISIISLLPLFDFALQRVRPEKPAAAVTAPAEAGGVAIPKQANILARIEKTEWGHGIVTWAQASPGRYMAFYACLIIVIMVIKGVAQFMGQTLMARVAIDISADMMRRVYGNVLRQELEFFDHTSTGSILNSCYREVFNLQQLVTMLASTRIMTPITMVILFGALLVLSWQLALLLLLLLPLVILPTLTITRKLRSSLNDEIGEESQVMDLMTEGLHGILAIKAFGAESVEREAIVPAIGGYVQSTRARRMAQAATGPMVDFLNMMVLLILFVIVLLFFIDRISLSGGQLMGFLMMITRFYRPMTTLLSMNVQMQRSRALAKRIFALLDREPAIRDVEHPRPFPTDWRTIELRGATLRYKIQRRRRPVRWRDAVVDAHLTIRRGDALAIVGPNGAGKSSIVKLLCRLYEPTEGEVLVGGVPLREIALEDLRRQVVLVTQQPVLFNRSVRENVLFGVSEPYPGAVEAAVKAVGAEGFVGRLPHGYDTEIGEAGRLLSGGERQKLAVARALVRQPSLLILDEPTTGLDKEAVEEFLETLRRLNEGGVTLVYITHEHAHLRWFRRVVEFTADHRLRERAAAETG